MKTNQICSVLLAMLLVKTMASHHDNAVSIINANNKFTSTMYELLRQTPGNVLYSPISLHTALSMLHQGAEGKTLKALSSTLNLPDKSSAADGFAKVTRALCNVDGVTLKIANKMYVKTGYSIKPAFKDVVVHKFHASLENIDFEKNVEAAKTINSWVEKKTHHKIKDLMSADDFDNYTRSVIVNAIYFKGDWLTKFDESSTWKAPFYITETDHVEVDMMHLTTGLDYKMNKDLDAEIIKLSYANKELSMVIVLPNERNGITELEDKLANYDLSTLTQDMNHYDFKLAMPRFKIEMKMDLKEPLKKAGLSNIFSSKANLSGLMDNSESLYVNKVVQKAFIEVNEEGSEAAVATAVEENGNEAGIEFAHVTLDHPFIFALQRQHNILFYGKLASFD